MRAFRIVILSLLATTASHARVHHFVYFGLERQGIAAEAFLSSAAEGAQLKYTWRELEPAKGHYDFTKVRADLTFLRSHNKKLFLQIQDVSFDAAVANVPDYLRSEKEYHGGAAPQYEWKEGHEDQAKAAGWVARRWDPAVRRRFQLLLQALGKDFDGAVEGVNLPETSVDFGESGKLFPPGFTCETYRDGIVENMAALQRAFPRSVTMQYANFMPCEWLPWKDGGYLESIYRQARRLGVGVGGPDLLPYRKGQMNHAYVRMRASAGIVPTGVAVQEGNYGYTNPQTGKRITVDELAKFANEYLHVDYLFWFNEAPFYERDVLPFLNGLRSEAPQARRYDRASRNRTCQNAFHWASYKTVSTSTLSLRASRDQHREVFSRVFRNNDWGDSESVSGPGSTRAQGRVVTPQLIDLVKRLGVTTLLDAPCGDFNWAGELSGTVRSYFGVDIVEELISRNVREHGDANRTFLVCDLTRDPLPGAELILSRDCLVHFSYADVWAALRNFRRSGADYLVTTTFVDRRTNRDIVTGAWRELNLQAAPFDFPAPIALIDERCLYSGGEHRDKRLALWHMDQVPR
jgi:hypothetical protein